jgi:hypothetical protein
MKRDMDLVREILIKIETNPAFNGDHNLWANRANLGITDYTDQEIVYNAAQLVEAGYLAGNVRMAHAGQVIVTKLTWRGHEYLDAIRDPDIWEKTKAKAKGVASVGMSFLFEIAKAEIKAKLGLQ